MKPEQRIRKIQELCVEAMQAESRHRRKRLNEIHRDLRLIVAEQIKWELRQEKRSAS